MLEEFYEFPSRKRCLKYVVLNSVSETLDKIYYKNFFYEIGEFGLLIVVHFFKDALEVNEKNFEINSDSF